MKPSDPKSTIPLQFIVVFCVFTLLVIAVGISQYISQKKRIVLEKHNELAAVASLKVEEIVQWRKERIRDGEVILNNISLNKRIADFFNNDKQYDIKQELVKWMQSLISNYDYQSILLIDNKKNVRLYYPSFDTIDNFLEFSIPEVFRKREIIFSDLHRSENMSAIHIDMMVPLFTRSKSDSTIFGVVVFRINPAITLFPFIQAWPTPSKSSETLLLRRDGDSVVFLNELRHKKNTALRLKFPLDNMSLPAAKAALGFEGEFQGLDYRNIQVVSNLKKIPDSPWFMVAKTDKEEIYSPLYKQLTEISVIAALLILIASAVIGLIWRNQRVGYYIKQLEYEHERNQALEALKESEAQLRELNATKDKFFTIIAHDLKSPFNSIIGLSELLAEKMNKKDYDGIEEYSKIIQSSSWRAMDLLTNLIVWSRLQTGKMVFKPELVDIESLITEVTELSKDSARQKSISVFIEVTSSLNILADKAMISSVFRNLISNAIKFTNPRGNISISAIQNDSEIKVTVSDDGIGITKDALEKLFLIEGSVSTPGTMREEGTGLGLILCKDFVLKHGGKIWAESEVGKGSRFIFTIPVTKEKA